MILDELLHITLHVVLVLHIETWARWDRPQVAGLDHNRSTPILSSLQSLAARIFIECLCHDSLVTVILLEL